MKRLCVLLCALLFALALGAGCQPGSLDAAMRDWNGENMQMRGLGPQPTPIKAP